MLTTIQFRAQARKVIRTDFFNRSIAVMPYIVSALVVISCSAHLSPEVPQSISRSNEKKISQALSLTWNIADFSKVVSDDILRLAYIHVFAKEHHYNKFGVRIDPKGTHTTRVFSTDNSGIELTFEMPVSAVTTLERGFLNQRSEASGLLKVFVYSQVSRIDSHYSFRSKAYVTDIDIVDNIGPYANTYGGGRLLRNSAFGEELSASITSILNQHIPIEKMVNGFVAELDQNLARNSGATVVGSAYQVTNTALVQDFFQINIFLTSRIIFKKSNPIRKSENPSFAKARFDRLSDFPVSCFPITKNISVDSLNKKIILDSLNEIVGESRLTIVNAAIQPYDSLFTLALKLKSKKASGMIFLFGELNQDAEGNLKFASLSLHNSSRIELQTKIDDLDLDQFENGIAKNFKILMDSDLFKLPDNWIGQDTSISFMESKETVSHIEGVQTGNMLSLVLFKIGEFKLQIK